jgi:hypothetical protein
MQYAWHVEKKAADGAVWYQKCNAKRIHYFKWFLADFVEYHHAYGCSILSWRQESNLLRHVSKKSREKNYNTLGTYPYGENF